MHKWKSSSYRDSQRLIFSSLAFLLLLFYSKVFSKMTKVTSRDLDEESRTQLASVFWFVARRAWVSDVRVLLTRARCSWMEIFNQSTEPILYSCGIFLPTPFETRLNFLRVYLFVFLFYFIDNIFISYLYRYCFLFSFLDNLWFLSINCYNISIC